MTLLRKMTLRNQSDLVKKIEVPMYVITQIGFLSQWSNWIRRCNRLVITKEANKTGKLMNYDEGHCTELY
jgi:hypothetical protein